MTAPSDYLDSQVETAPELTEDEVRDCDEKALKYLMVSPRDLAKKKEVISRLRSVYYRESSADGGALIVCSNDGSVLFAGSFVSKGAHILGFENGLRTSPELLLERKSHVDSYDS